jgi:hypothetical protein
MVNKKCSKCRLDFDTETESYTIFRGDEEQELCLCEECSFIMLALMDMGDMLQ